MKIFVSSRMHELREERKIIIDNLHFWGHTPLYIETEPQVKDEDAKRVMDNLIDQAEALVLLFYLSEGSQSDILNNLTPIQYEYKRFRETKSGAPIIVFQKDTDNLISASLPMIDWFKRETSKAGIKIRNFFLSKHLTNGLRDAVKELALTTDAPQNESNRLIVQYVGPDFTGLIGNVSETLFNLYGINIDYISHASRGGKAALFMSCSSRASMPELSNVKDEIEARVLVAKEMARKDNLLMPGADFKETPRVDVELDKTKMVPWQFYMEVRTIDTPGQLNAICKVLLDLKFNIDEMMQKPPEKEYKRQNILMLWLSKRGTEESNNYPDELISLENEIRMLVGVRSFSIKVVNYTPDLEEVVNRLHK